MSALESITLPRDEWERVLIALAVYANTRESDDRPEFAEDIRSTGRAIANQMNEEWLAGYRGKSR